MVSDPHAHTLLKDSVSNKIQLASLSLGYVVQGSWSALQFHHLIMYADVIQQ